MIHLITGKKGYEHIQSSDQGRFNASFFGTGEYVLQFGNQCKAEYINNNTVRILDGEILMQGRHISIEPNTYEDITIQTGTAGKNRADLIVMTYIKDASNGTEDARIEVIQGEETTGTATLPSCTHGNIFEGAIINQMPLYRVDIQGVTLASDIKPLFKSIPTYAALASKYEQDFIDACETYLDSLNILDSVSDINANTESNQLAGALAVKEVVQDLEEHTHDDRYLTETETNTKLNAKQNTMIVEKKTSTTIVTVKEDGIATLSISISKSGYTPVAIVGFDTNDEHIIPLAVYLDSTKAKMKVRCIGDKTEGDEVSSFSTSFSGYYVNVLYKKN